MTSSWHLMVRLDRHSPLPLVAQLRNEIREAIRRGSLRAGVRLPSTRTLSLDLKVSRPIVVDAYEQLAAEGYLLTRHGARAVVARVRRQPARSASESDTRAPAILHDLRPAMPDLAQFPRKRWGRSLRVALGQLANQDLGYGEPHGTQRLRRTLAEYLGRVRGVVADPSAIMITAGFAEARAIACRALVAAGITTVAVEDPGYSSWHTVDEAGLKRVAIPVDERGLLTGELPATQARAVFVTPAHQFPMGGVLSSERRLALIRWLEERKGYALEDDYDAEFRYEHAPVAALQSLSPQRVLYAGTVSKTLAPALRLGWLVVPTALQTAARSAQRVWSEGPPRIEQNALAHFLEAGEYDRHLRRMRKLYRTRRDQLVRLLAEHLPRASVSGIAAGLHVTLKLPEDIDESAVVAKLARRGVAVEGVSKYRARRTRSQATLLLGYGRASESAVTFAVRVLQQMVSGWAQGGRK